MKSIQAFNPESEHYLDHTHLAVNYCLDYNLLSMESTSAKCTLEKADMEIAGDVLGELASLRAAFPTLLKAIQIALTIAVSTAECERCFSALK